MAPAKQDDFRFGCLMRVSTRDAFPCRRPLLGEGNRCQKCSRPVRHHGIGGRVPVFIGNGMQPDESFRFDDLGIFDTLVVRSTTKSHFVQPQAPGPDIQLVNDGFHARAIPSASSAGSVQVFQTSSRGALKRLSKIYSGKDTLLLPVFRVFQFIEQTVELIETR